MPNPPTIEILQFREKSGVKEGIWRGREEAKMQNFQDV